MTAPLDAYLLAIALVTGLGGFAIAADVYARVLARRGGRVLDAYATVLAIAVALGMAVLGPAAVVGRPQGAGLLGALAVGLVVGAGARSLDRSIVRAAARRAVPPRGTAARRRGALADSALPARMSPAPGVQLLGGSSRRATGAHRAQLPAATVDPRQFPLATVVAVAVVEELFYRGVLLAAALRAGGVRAGLLVMASVAAFALVHVTFGWAHVLAKLPLGVGAVASVLALGSVVPAVAAHVWFNLSVWRELRGGGEPRR